MSNGHEVTIQDIWLMREGGESDLLPRVVVYVKRNGAWYEAIRELLDSNFSHCISSYGLLDEQYCKPAAWLNEKMKHEPLVPLSPLALPLNEKPKRKEQEP